MIHLIADRSSERLLYILEIIFKTILKTPYTFVDLSVNRELKYGSGEVVLNYSSQNIPGSFGIPVAGLLLEEDINNRQPPIKNDTLPKLYPAKEGDFDMDYDIFSASFYLITEYEKYACKEFDKHGRYK